MKRWWLDLDSLADKVRRTFAGDASRRGRHDEGITMGAEDKAKNAAENASGKVKEAAGRATGNEQLEAEGRTDQAKADLKQAGEKVKDALK